MAGFHFRDLAPAEIDAIVRDMDEQGYACLADALPPAAIAEARAWVLRELDRYGGEYFSYIGREAMSGSLMADLGVSPDLRRLLAAIYERGLGKPAPSSGLFQVLRVVSGASGIKQSYQFHYDAYVVTALVPIIIPSAPGEKRGDLVLYPQLRRIRSSVVVNMLEKIVLQNALGRQVARSPLVQRLLGAKLVRMAPGSIYFFWGYQSLHGNEPCDAASVRSTALFHFADPHAQSVLPALVRRLRGWHERRLRERALAR
jgi:hypothetical protein